MTIFARDLNGVAIQAGGWGASQDVAYTASVGESAAMGTNTRLARLLATTDCRIKITTAGTDAVSTDTYLVAFQPEYVKVKPLDIVSAIRVSASGTLNVTEIS